MCRDFYFKYSNDKDSLLNISYPPHEEIIKKYFVTINSLKDLEVIIRETLEKISINNETITFDFENRIVDFKIGNQNFQIPFNIKIEQEKKKIFFTFFNPSNYISIVVDNENNKFFIGLVEDIIISFNQYLTKNIIEYKLKLKRKDNKILDNNNNFYYI